MNSTTRRFTAIIGNRLGLILPLNMAFASLNPSSS